MKEPSTRTQTDLGVLTKRTPFLQEKMEITEVRLTPHSSLLTPHYLLLTTHYLLLTTYYSLLTTY